MNKKQKSNWWIDILLLISFLFAFFLDFTGLITHQWIGGISFVFAAIHLFLHRSWVKSIAKRFFRRRTGKPRLNFVIDSSILLGFLLIIVTGLMISTWMNLALPNYDVWRELHIAGSIASLVLLLIKLVLHFRWLEQTTRRMFTRNVTKPVMMPRNTVLVQSASDDSKRIGRREFLVTMSVVSGASILALASASKSLAEIITPAESTNADGTPSPTVESTETSSQNIESSPTPQATETAETAVQPSATVVSPTQTATQETAETATTSIPTTESNCTVRCGKGCSYPGHCHRYSDANNNNLCDLGECL